MRPIALVALSFSLVLPLSLLVVPEVAAFELSVVELSGCENFDPNDPLQAGCFGEIITIGLRVENPEGHSSSGIGAAAWGYDDFARFVSGFAVSEVFHPICLPTIGCFNGHDNLAGGDLTEHSMAVGSKVQFLTVATSLGIDGEGIDSPGIDGVQGGGGAQFRLMFEIMNAGAIFLKIGIDPAFGNAWYIDGVLQEPPPPIQILLSSEEPPRIVPEPSVSLLFGFGLLGLARLGRRMPV